MAAGSSEAAEEYEERTIVLELRGVFDAEVVRAAVSSGETRIIHVDTEAPVVQIGGGLYACRWEQPVGTDLIFRENSANHSLELDGVGDRRLVAEKAFIVPRTTDNRENGSANS